MQSNRCNVCIGSGSIMGGGMIMKECHGCKGSGKTIMEEAFSSKGLIRKNSRGYKRAKLKIKSLSDRITEEEAEKLLDEELEKQENVG